MKGFRRAEKKLRTVSILLVITGTSVIAVQFMDFNAQAKSAWTIFLILLNMVMIYQLDRCAYYFLQNSTRDELTGVYNYRYLITRLDEEMSRSVRYGRPLALAFIDCDNFKSFNDKYGHMEGNHVLKQIGRILRDNIRASDIVARFGGDEFAVILPETELISARIVMERARKTIENTVFKFEPGEVTLSISLVNYEGEDLGVFLERADAYLYKVKMDRKNRVIEQKV